MSKQTKRQKSTNPRRSPRRWHDRGHILKTWNA
jgi:hypothetical protein